MNLYGLFLVLFLSTKALASADFVLIGLGGYASCGLGPLTHPVAKATLDLAKSISTEQHREPRVILSCLNMTSSSSNIYDQHGTFLNQANLTELIATVQDAVAATRQKRIIIFGHSHGGWLAMNIAAKLPVDIKVDYLFTIDPISQAECIPLKFGSEVAAGMIGDPKSNDCERFPIDITEAMQLQISARVKAWGHFYQDTTKELHSSPSGHSHFSELISYPNLDNQRLAHSLVAGNVEVWRQISDIVLHDKTLDAQHTPKMFLGSLLKPLYILPNAVASGRFFVRYRKPSFVFFARRGRRREVSVFQPSAEPILGLNLKLSPNLGLGYAQPMPFLQVRPKKQGRSRTRVFDLHFVQNRWSFDLYLHDYTSLFRTQIPRGEVKILGDAMFRDFDDIEVFSDMTLRGIGLDALYVLWPNNFSLLAAMSQRVIAQRSGWSPTILSSIRYSESYASRPILSILANDDAKYQNLFGFSSVAMTILPGLAGIYVYDQYFISAIAAYGYGMQHSNLAGAATSAPDYPVAMTNLQGSLGINTNSLFSGMAIYYSNSSRSKGQVGFYEALSSVEIFFGMHL